MLAKQIAEGSSHQVGQRPPEDFVIWNRNQSSEHEINIYLEKASKRRSKKASAVLLKIQEKATNNLNPEMRITNIHSYRSTLMAVLPSLWHLAWFAPI